MRTIILTTLAMLAFAANSILCRLALGHLQIDAATFTAVRLISGALTLTILLSVTQRGVIKNQLNWPSSLALYGYAICFSFAYVTLSTGTGALILFGTVQLSLIIIGIIHGEKPTPLKWLGSLVASSGLVYLMLPGVGAPSILGASLMFLAGLAWAIYSLRGKSTRDAIASTTWNFIGTVPFVIVSSMIFISHYHASVSGILLAIASGALASGIGYVIWYAALPKLTWMSAAIVQISVPMIAAMGGVIFMSEQFSIRLLVSSTMILGGIVLVIVAKRPAR